MDLRQSFRSAAFQSCQIVCETHRVGADQIKILAGQVHLRQRPAYSSRLIDCRLSWRDAGQEFDQRNGFAIEHAERRAIAIMNSLGNGAALGRKMIEQAQEIGQIFQLDTPFVHGEDEAIATAPARCLDQPVRIGDAFGDALGRCQRADIILADKISQFFRAKMSVDGQFLFHQLAWQLENHLFFSCSDGLLGHVAQLCDFVDHFAHQDLRR